MGYSVTEALCHQSGVLSEPLRNISVHPAALFVQLIWQFPVIQRNIRFNIILYQSIDQIAVKPYSFLVYSPCPLGQNTCPVNRKPVCLQSDFFHNAYILAKTVIMIACGLSCMPAIYLSGFFCIHIPNMHSLACSFYTALNLISAGSCTPDKIVRKSHM